MVRGFVLRRELQFFDLSTGGQGQGQEERKEVGGLPTY